MIESRVVVYVFLEFRCSLVHSSLEVPLLYHNVLLHTLFQQSTGLVIVASGEST